MEPVTMAMLGAAGIGAASQLVGGLLGRKAQREAENRQGFRSAIQEMGQTQQDIIGQSGKTQQDLLANLINQYRQNLE